MNTTIWFAFVVGLLIGWLIEWLIDWFYWRRQCRQMEAALHVAVEGSDTDLQRIKGIGPVIAQKLNEAGIFTFAQLGNLTVAELEAIVGEDIKRLADEEAILRQARELAAKFKK